MFATKMVGLILGFLLALVSLTGWGQTLSEDDISVEGFSFARFNLSLELTREFTRSADSRQWREMTEKNLCWSGVFKLTNGQTSYCRATQGREDVRIKLDWVRESELFLTLADDDGTPLFQQKIKTRPALSEADLYRAINKITERLTGLPGILGSTLAFSFRQPKRLKVIARVNTHGQNLTAVSFNDQINILPRFSPSGTSIIYTTLGKLGNAVVRKNMLNDKVDTIASFRGVNSGGTWNQEGTKLILTLSRAENADLYEHDLQTGALKRLTQHWGIDTSPALSPNGDYLLFVSDRGGSEQIYLMYLATREIFRLTFTGTKNSDPAWSPDGSLFAFTKTIAGRDQIYVMDLFGEKTQALTRGPYHSEQPAWSPDGRQIAFSSNRTGDSKIYTVFLDGSGLRRVSDTPKGFEEKSPTWTLRSF